MVGKSYQKKNKERISGAKSCTDVLKKNEGVKYPCFKSNELPDHHFPTVKDWLNGLGNELLGFSESLVKKIKHEKTGKPFVSDTFSISDINNSLFNFYNLLDSSVEALHEFRDAMCDYISTWKVTLGDALICESSDSSVEIIESDDASTSTKAAVNNQNKDVNSADIKEGPEPEIKFGGLRIRKPSEVNKLMLEELSNEGSVSLNASNDSCSSKSYPDTVTNNLKKTIGADSIEEINNSNCRPKLGNNRNKSLSTTKLKESESTNKETETNSVVEPSFSETNLSQEAVNIDVSEDCIDSSHLKEKETSPPKKKSVINWDTSSDSLIDNEWLVEKKTNEAKNNEGSKKKVLRKKLDPKSKKKDSLFSSSDDDCSNLCNLGSLNKKKRKHKDSDDSSSSSSKHEKESNKSKRSKLKENLPSLLSFADGDKSEDSGPLDDNDLFTLNIDKYTKSFKEADTFKAEDFLQSDIEERSLSVISDSSLDSIVNELQKTCEVKRRTEKQKGVKKSQNMSENKKKRARRKRDRLLDEKLTDTNSSEAEKEWNKIKMKKRIQSSDSFSTLC